MLENTESATGFGIGFSMFSVPISIFKSNIEHRRRFLIGLRHAIQFNANCWNQA